MAKHKIEEWQRCQYCDDAGVGLTVGKGKTLRICMIHAQIIKHKIIGWEKAEAERY